MDEFSTLWIVYLGCLGCFVPLWVISIIQNYRFIKMHQMNNAKFHTHALLFVAICCGLLDNAGRVAWQSNAFHILSQDGFCFIPSSFTWYFMLCAYYLTLYHWVKVYFTKMRKSLISFQIIFVIINVVTLTAAAASSAMLCIEAGIDYDASGIYEVAGDIIYDGFIAGNGVILAGGFLVYGLKIIYNLKSCHRPDSTERDAHLYRVTRRMIFLCSTMIVGVIVDVILIFIPFFNMSTSIVATFFQILFISELMYFTRPIKTKILCTVPSTNSQNSPRSLLSSFSSQRSFSSISLPI